jgi:crotonobetainyl-CoA:carnitine CoA-transferase CaiB-like acyl-CoA transferase
MCAMMLADLGATVLRIGRHEQVELGTARPLKFDFLRRGRPEIRLNLKSTDEHQIALDLISQADALIEGFRPGVMERLGLGPDVCLGRNPKLIYGRMTGWGQTGSLSQAAGHDLNYIALTGALDAIGRRDAPPTPPLNLLGDYGGGSLYLAVGLLSAIIEAQRSGKGQVVDAAIVDGTVNLMTHLYGAHAAGLWNAERGTNIVDGGAYFYDVYQCADEKWVSVAPIEGRFHAELLKRLGIDAAECPAQHDTSAWEKMRERLAQCFRKKTRDEWCAELEGTDVCFAPVLSAKEAPLHPHLRERGVFDEVDGVIQPAPAPRFSRTVPDKPAPVTKTSAAMKGEALKAWLGAERMAQLRADGLLENM